MARLRHPPCPRWVAIALLLLLTATAVHGAGSVAVPAVAIAAGPASIGAALLHQTISPGGRSGADDAATQRDDRQYADDRPRSAGGDRAGLPPVLAANWPSGPDTGTGCVHRRPGDHVTGGTQRCHGSRAPPANPSLT
ncbi:hypothetical protein O7623_30225 [Solwaraspora sp. WMMD791]|uniref:hypothetical protein n=1 Tax=Solwaraspora sp. WMMD791 TaxID=3016086 RepID=UPI00249CE828|nr:hypothetical protein [Solwaraspora sp. WMMD791]WFE27452.1 hypothetical protein O7623_30225 [Solwaraspora sp. WMMD791]